MRQLKISRQVTNRDTESFDIYLSEINKIERVSAEEEVVLAFKIKKGDKNALHRLVNANLRFVVSVSKQYQNQGLSLPDLINEGNFGLIKAAQRYDETRGFKFISYAVWWIRQSIIQSIAEQSRIVRLPQNKISSVTRILKLYSQLEQEFEREPTSEEIAEILEMAPREVKDILASSGKHISMDVPVSQDSEVNIVDTISDDKSGSPDSGLLKDSLLKEIERVFSTLSDRESQILRLFYGLGGRLPLSITEISDEFGVSPERVRQLKDSAIKKLQLRSRNNLLRKFLGD